MNGSWRSLSTLSKEEQEKCLRTFWPYHPRLLQAEVVAAVVDERASLCGDTWGLGIFHGQKGTYAACGGDVPPEVPRALEGLVHLSEYLCPYAVDPDGDVEVLNWERRPDRGPLHDPPYRWWPLSPDAYRALREAWGREGVAWIRHPDVWLTWGERLPLQAFAVGPTEEPMAAMLLWVPSPDFVYIVDLVWDPARGPRSVVRYLLQELYMHHPRAHVVLDGERVDSALNKVLMALGYRVYRRQWEGRGDE